MTRLHGNPWMDALTTAATTLVSLYVGAVLFAYFFSDFMIFPYRQEIPPDAPQPRDFLTIPIDGRTEISCLYLPHPNARFTILYSHGNYEDVPSLVSYLKDEYHDREYGVLAYDFPGYGFSNGKPTEESTYAAIEAAYSFLVDDLGIPANRIIALGRSLGGGPTIELACRHPLAGVILESSFVSAFRVMTRIPMIPGDKYRNLSKIAVIGCPSFFVHGTEDEVVGFWHGQMLYDRAIDPKRFLWVEGAGHNNLQEYAGNVYRDALDDFARSLTE